MQRRAFLVGAAGATTLLSGCLGYTVEESSDVEQRKNRIQELENTSSSQQQQISSLESQLQEKNESIQSMESEVESLEEDLDQEKREEILLLYDRGMAAYDHAGSDWDEARVAWSGENYGTASMYFFRAEGHYVEAYNDWELATTRAADEGYTSVVSSVNESQSYVDHMANAANDYANAAYWYSYNDDAKGNEYFNDGQSDFDKAEQYSVTSREVIRSELELS